MCILVHSVVQCNVYIFKLKLYFKIIQISFITTLSCNAKLFAENKFIFSILLHQVVPTATNNISA